MDERLARLARMVMILAQHEAQDLNHEYVGTEHVLPGLVREGRGIAGNVLKNLHIDHRKVRLEVEKIVPPGPDMIVMGRLPWTPRVKQAVEFAVEESRALGDDYVSTEHLLLGLLRAEGSVAFQVLTNLGLNLEDTRQECLHMRNVFMEIEVPEEGEVFDLACLFSIMYPEGEKARRVLSKVGLGPDRIDLNGAAMLRWERGLDFAARRRKLEALAEDAAREYPARREEIEEAARRYLQGRPAVPPTLVLLVHGIRTQSEWQGWLRDQIEEQGNCIVVPLKYGFFDTVSFLSPFFTRSRPLKMLEWKIEHAIHDNKGCELVIVAHSFGTYAVMELLKQKPHVRPARMLFCGSIVARGYRWDQLKNLGEVLNDCGTKDIWPVLAESTSWGYGSSGTFGFGSPNINDRFHPMRHSDYFAKDFVEHYWLPWICHGTLVKSSTEVERPTSPYWLSLLTVVHIKYLLLLIALVALAWRLF